MKRKQFLKAAAGAAAVLLTPMLGGCGGGGDDADESAQAEGGLPSAQTETASGAKRTSTTAVLTAEEIAGMNYMREEEKLAHDVYVALYAL